MHENIGRLLVEAVDTYNTLARYQQLITLVEDCLTRDVEQAQILLTLYSSNVEELFETLGENLESCHQEMHLLKNQEFINRAERHLQQLRESFPDAVAITIHDTDESKGYPYLDLYAPIPLRLNPDTFSLASQSATSLLRFQLPDIITLSVPWPMGSKSDTATSTKMIAYGSLTLP